MSSSQSLRSAVREDDEVLECPSGTATSTKEWNWLLGGMLVAGLSILLYLNLRNALFQPLLLEADTHHWERLILQPAVLWGLMGTVLLAIRSTLWLRYRDVPAAGFQDAPSLTVVIPAYNEGKMVLQSIESVAKASYPSDRLKIIVVDDGSKDDTWAHIMKAADRYPALVLPVRLPQNCGKRAALAVGFEKARSELVVTLDSDSVIDSGSLLALAGPFRNPRIGAVAGKVKVYNKKDGLIPRMLAVRYILTFDYLRACESGYRTVYCCPGALTAYRTSIVRQVMDKWLHQTFLGARCTIGEDRALTNFILSLGYDTVYQRSAVVYTVVPTRYSKLCRMFLRWDRSYVREELRFFRIVWSRPIGPRIMALFERFITNVRYPISYATLFLLFISVVHHPRAIVRLVIVIGVVSAANMIYYLRSEWSPEFVYGIVYSYFSLVALFWIFPVALFTARSRSWLTR